MSTFTFGLEFEVEGISPNRAAHAITAAGIQCDRVQSDIHDTYSEWKAVYDGSLTNGAEVVSPILNDARLNEARKVARVLSENGARVDRSTGYHIHIGSAAFNGSERTLAENLSAFVLNYYATHHAFGALVAPSRLRNRRFCRVLGQDEAIAEAEYVRDGNFGSRRGDRYQSLNLESLGRHGTVEVRLHQGTLNGVKAIAWVQLMTALVKATSAGVDLADAELGLNAWRPVDGYGNAQASVEDCGTLLNLLTERGLLAASTADWLKNRAGKLNG